MYGIYITTFLALTSVANGLPRHKHEHDGKYGRYYPSWAGIKYMIVFGDSYTTTGFNDTLTQPSSVNPLGNPDYPGGTSSNGPNWVDYLTTTYNASLIETVNLAYGGATVDSALVAPYLPTVLSVVQQVETEYLPKYSTSPSFYPWTSNNTLFAIFIGINDVGNSYQAQNTSLAPIFARLAGLVDQLHTTGARNFLFLNVPPVDRSPLTVSQGPANASLEAQSIRDWNTRLEQLSSNLTSTYTDVTSFIFDTNTVFGEVLDRPCVFKTTCAYENTTDYCTEYENGTAAWDTFVQACGVSVDRYFWLNSLHPTFRMHKVIAELVAGELA